jgi:hypothetical protein
MAIIAVLAFGKFRNHDVVRIGLQGRNQHLARGQIVSDKGSANRLFGTGVGHKITSLAFRWSNIVRPYFVGTTNE